MDKPIPRAWGVLILCHHLKETIESLMKHLLASY